MGRRSLAFTLLLLFLFQEDSIAAVDRVWTCGGFDCSRLISGAGDTLNAAGADSTIACKTGTTAAMPATCTIGECYFVTNPTVVGKNLFGCTATNTWNLLGDGGSAGSTSFSALTAGTNSNAGYMIVGGGTAIASNGGAIVATDLDCTGCVADTELASNYSGVGPQCLYGTVINQLNDNAAPTCAQVDHPATANLTTGDDHTQYALLAGRASGQTLSGGVAAGALTLSGSANALGATYSTSFGKIRPFGEIVWQDLNTTFPSGQNAGHYSMLVWKKRADVDNASTFLHGVDMHTDSIVEYGVSPNPTIGASLFRNGMTIQNGQVNETGSYATLNLAGVATVHSRPLLKARGTASSFNLTDYFGLRLASFFDDTSFAVEGAGTFASNSLLHQFRARGASTTGGMTVPNLTGFSCAAPVQTTGTGSSMATRKCFVVEDHTANIYAPTPNLQITSIVGIENNESTVYPDKASQVINNVANQIFPNATLVTIFAAGDFTLTSNPQITDGFDGQILFIRGQSTMAAGNDITIVDGSGVELNIFGISFGKSDVAQFIFDSVADKWLLVSYSDNVTP